MSKQLYHKYHSLHRLNFGVNILSNFALIHYMRNSSESFPDTQNYKNKKTESCFFKAKGAKIVPLPLLNCTETQKSCLIRTSTG